MAAHKRTRKALTTPELQRKRARGWQLQQLDELIADIERDGFREVSADEIGAAFADSAAEPLGDVGDLVAGHEELLEGVEVGDDATELTYELWDAETGNAQGVYASLPQALTVVREALRRDGRETLRGLSLVEVRSGRRRLLAQGDGLIPLVGEPRATP